MLICMMIFQYNNVITSAIREDTSNSIAQRQSSNHHCTVSSGIDAFPCKMQDNLREIEMARPRKPQE